MRSDTCCEVNGLTKYYGRLKVLEGCSLVIKKGEMVGLIGENGSGKSSFLKCLMGFTKPTLGEVKLNGTVGYCPQENILNRKYTVAEHLTLSQAIYSRYCKISSKYTLNLISKFKLEAYMNVLIENLSSGTYQKVKLITSLYHNPGLLLLDEPYEGFDWKMYQAFWEVVDELKSDGTAILMISHLIYDREHFDRILEIRNGQLEEI